MARTLNRLSAVKVAKAKQPGMLCDGGGLYLRVADGGSKQWIFRYVTDGRTRDMGIGPAHTLTLVEARERAAQARKLRLDGLDPIDQKRARVTAGKRRVMTFRECAEGFIRDNEKEWSNAEHHNQWVTTLTDYVYPKLGAMAVDAIDTPLVLEVIKPLWERIPTTAKRTLSRIENVLGWATVHHYRKGDNPARWTGLLEHALPAISKVAKVKHHAALHYKEAPAFMGKLRGDTGIPARCLEFIVLTAARLSEATGATWDQINMADRMWTVPADDMKGRREHRVPLSDAAMKVLQDLQAVRQSEYVFPGMVAGRPVGDKTIQYLAKDMTDSPITVHGLRSTFRDWAAEATNFPEFVAEMALAHAVPTAVERAYRRGDLFEKRRLLMDAWADFCGKPASSGATVTPMRSVR